ncbi:hypothetical protein F3Y22_tig00000916pilonHSYRG00135 [Hibiscus syriacus]|uniref:Uncharacterized protein n=1 Tax=Hibiscus syriacus TaxID=106335 RepID=A0A6A3CZR6_HIBSY|nr:hypothetical protein F3Y22_tig00000916pilonHSYRG00135 [Hibiscus syriacus]
MEKSDPFKELPSKLPVAKLLPDKIEIMMTLDDTSEQGVNAANIVQEIRTQVRPEMFELSNIVWNIC